MVWVRALAAVAAAAALAAPAAAAPAGQRAEYWVGTWGFSPTPQPPGLPAITGPAVLPVPLEPAPAPPAPPPGGPFRPLVENPGGLPVDLTNTGDLANLTLRQAVRVSVGGSRLRLRLSNETGSTPLAIGAVHVGLAGPDGVATSDRVVTFDGGGAVVVPAGAPLVSDAIELPTRALDRLYVSIYLPGQIGRAARQVFQYTAGQAGDFTASASLPGAKLMRAPALVTAVEVDAGRPTNVLVTLGDSITEGALSTALAFRSYPDRLAERFAAAGANWAVVNEGIGGNRLLRHGTGPSALARFDRDVLGVPGVKAIIVLEGINDIGRGFSGAAEPVTTKALIAAQKQIIARAHAHGIRVIGATLTPYRGANYATEAGEAVRQEYNNWIRTSGAFDAVIDFAAPLASATDPTSFDRRYNDRDNLHPNDAGYKVMADFVDLTAITGR